MKVRYTRFEVVFRETTLVFTDRDPIRLRRAARQEVREVHSHQ